MVYFTCNHCGDSMKRVAVEKHYSFGCRGAPIFLTCIDCLKDFDKSNYNNHTSCITEAERYSGKGFVHKESKNLKKQEEFVEVVRRIQATRSDISDGVKNILSIIADKDNLPRKRLNFIRYLQNSVRYLQQKDIENTWAVLEEAKKESTNQQQALQQQAVNGNANVPAQNGNQKRKLDSDEQNGNQKRKLDSDEEQVPSHNGNKKIKRSKKDDAAAIDSEPSKKLKHLVNVNNEDHNNTDSNIKDISNDSGKFNWSETIKNILNSKNNEMKLKKLKKKVLNKYKKYSGIDEINDRIEKKLNKKITKLGLIVADDNIRLISH